MQKDHHDSDCQKLVTLRAHKLLRHDRPQIGRLPTILCTIFGIVGAFGGALMSAVLYQPRQMPESALTSLCGAGLVGCIGGLIGLRIQKVFLKPYLAAAANEIARTSTKHPDSERVSPE
jgi:hypothetical protein